MDELSDRVIRRNASSSGERSYPKVFTTLVNVTRGVFHYAPRDTHLFGRALEEAGLPMRKTKHYEEDERPRYYWVILEKHKKRAIAILNRDERLARFKKNPVKLICGKYKGKYPNTTDLAGKRGFERTGVMLKKAGIISSVSSGFRPFKTSDVLKGCPIPVFGPKNGGLCVPTAQASKFKKYVEQKMRRLRKERSIGLI